MRKMRKIWITLLACLCVGVFSVGFTACNDDEANNDQSQQSNLECASGVGGNEGEVHVHSWDEGRVTTEATCTGMGVTTYSCKECSKTYTKDIPISNHTYVNGECICGKKVSEGLEYALNEGGSSYSVTGIGVCTDTDIVIPSTYENLPVTSIGVGAFAELFMLESVEIPDSITNIGYTAFAVCTSLRTIIVSENNEAYQSIDGNLYTKDGKTLMQYALAKTDVSFSVPDSVRSIDLWAFAYCSSLMNVIISDSVTSIGEYAFIECALLMRVEIGNSVTSIGEEAFSECYKLVEVYNKSSLSIAVGDKSYGYIGYYAKEVYTEPNKSKLSMTDGGYILYTDGDLVSLMGYVGTETDLLLPETVTEIYQYAFYKGPSRIIGDTIISISNPLTSVKIGNLVTSIGEGAFSNCTSLVSAIISASVTSIEGSAFAGCISLCNIAVDQNNTAYQSIDGNLYTKDGKTLAKYAIGKTNASFAIPDSVTKIGDSAFSLCFSLTSVIIPDSVTSIGVFAFRNCASLENMTIGNSVTSIEEFVFWDCQSLTSITFNGTVAEWNAIEKGSNWKDNVPATEVVCNDGTVAL